MEEQRTFTINSLQTSHLPLWPGKISPDYFRHHCEVTHAFQRKAPAFIAWSFERQGLTM